MEGIVAEGFTLPLDDYLHSDQHDTVYSATMGHLEQGGYSITSSYERVKNWIFVSLQIEKIDYDAQRLDYDRGLALFIDSIRQRRMHQLKSDPSLAEMVPNGQLDDITPIILERAKRLYDYLISQKVTFWIISGGVDREKLFNLTNSLSEP